MPFSHPSLGLSVFFLSFGHGNASSNQLKIVARRAEPWRARRGRAQPSSQCQPRAAVDRQAHASTRTHCSEGKGEGLAPSPRGELPRTTTRPRTHHPAAWRSAGLQPVFACRLSFARAPWASGWRAGDAALSAQRRVPDGVRPRVTREVRSGCVAVSLAECLVLWFCVSLLCDRHRPSSVHPYRVGVPVVGRTVFRLPINQYSR